MQPYGSWQPPPPPKPSSNAWIGVVLGLLVALLVLGGAAIIGGVVYLRAKTKAIATARAASTWSDSASPVPVTSADPIWGDRTAPVTMVVFADFEDPFSARLATTIDSLKSLYGPTQLRVVWKHQPLSYHANAHDAAEAAAAVFELKGADAFWHFEERAFANQRSLSTGSYETWASESSVDMIAFRDGMLHHRWASKVDDDDRLAKSLGATPPVAYVNGVKVVGAQPLSTWQKAIDDELPKAKLSMSSGVAGDRIYVVRSTDNYGTSTAPAAPTTTYAPPTIAMTVHRVPVGTSPVLGKSDALVTLVEFADFQCPFCDRAEATLATLRTKYGADLRIVWKNLPLAFHVHALPAAELALETREEKGDAAFWTVHDALYASQRSPGLDDVSLLRIAHDNGVSEAKVKSAIATNKHKAILDADSALAKAVGAVGTPTCFVNGRLVNGAQPVTVFETVVDEELKKAKDRVSKGTARAKVYDEILASAVD